MTKYYKAEILIEVEDWWVDWDSPEEVKWFYSVLSEASSLFIPEVGDTIPCEVTKLEEIKNV